MSRVPNLVSRALLLAPLAVVAAATGCISESGVDLFPLYRDLEEDGREEFSILWPLSNFESDADGASSWVAPFYYAMEEGEESEGLIVPLIPPIWISSDAPLGRSRTVFPLYSTKTDDRRTESDLLLFLANWRSYEGEDGLAALKVLPLFQWEDDVGRRRFALAHVGGPAQGALVSLFERERAGVAYHGDGDEVGTRVDVGTALFQFVDLFHYDDIGSHTDVRFLNVTGNDLVSLFQHVSPHEGAPGADWGRTVLFPLWWDIEDAGRRTRHLWPLYGATTKGGETLVHWVVFPLLRLEDDPESGVSRTDFLWPLIGHKEDAERSRTWFFPVFQQTSTPKGYAWDVILGMFGYAAGEEESQLTLFWFPISL